MPWILVVLVLGVASLASAEDFLCHSDSRPQCGGTPGLHRYLQSQNPGTFSGSGCVMLPSKPGSIAADQRAVYSAIAAQQPHGRCYMTIVDARIVEMSASEKTAVNDAIAAALAPGLALEAERVTNTACNTGDLNVINDRINAVFDANEADLTAASTLALLRTATLTVNNRNRALIRQLARCLIARTP